MLLGEIQAKARVVLMDPNSARPESAEGPQPDCQRVGCAVGLPREDVSVDERSNVTEPWPEPDEDDMQSADEDAAAITHFRGRQSHYTQRPAEDDHSNGVITDLPTDGEWGYLRCQGRPCDASYGPTDGVRERMSGSRTWEPSDRTGGPLDDVLDRVRSRFPEVTIDRLVSSHLADDDNVYWLRLGAIEVQVDTGPDGALPFVVESDRPGSRLSTFDPAQALACASRELHLEPTMPGSASRSVAGWVALWSGGAAQAGTPEEICLLYTSGMPLTPPSPSPPSTPPTASTRPAAMRSGHFALLSPDTRHTRCMPC